MRPIRRDLSAIVEVARPMELVVPFANDSMLIGDVEETRASVVEESREES